MKSFRNMIEEDKKTTSMDNKTKENKFLELCEELGKKKVMLLLSGMNNTGKRVMEANQSVESFIRDMGFKIKEEKAGIRKKEIIFFKLEDANDALEDLIEAGFEDKYNFDINEKKKSISYTL